MRTWSALVVVAFALAAQDPAAQRGGPSREDNAPVLRGQVRSDDINATPLRRARVVVADGEPVFTDSGGRFAIAIPKTPAVLRITKPGYSPRHVRVDVVPAEATELRLLRGAAIVGGVFDELNGPAVGVTVRVRRVDEGAPDRVPIDTATQTDDQGEFRVGSLPEGEYMLAVEGRDARASGPGKVRVRAGEEVGVALLHDLRTEEARAAESFVAGAEDAEAARKERRATQLRGTATVRGRIDGPHGRPVAGAIVRLDPVSTGMPRVVASDINGTFQIADVVGGVYRVRATKEGLLSGEYGDERAVGFRRITVREGQPLDDIDVRLRSASVVTGNVVDADGEPIEGLAMHVWQVNNVGGRRFAEPVVGVAIRRTDDRGSYRLHGLQPGTYHVVAADHPGAGRASAYVPDAARSYFPGVGLIAEAAPIRVDRGLDAFGVDFTFRTTTTVRVSGEARTSQGQPLNRPLTLTGSAVMSLIAMPPLEAAPVGAAFEFKHVPRGVYVLQGMYVVPGSAGPEAIESVTTRVTVTGELQLAPLTTSPGSTISGYVIAEGNTLPPLPGRWLEAMPFNLDEAPRRTPTPWTVHTAEDGSFYISGLQGSMRFIGTPALPAGWWLKSIEIDGRIAAVSPFSFGAPVHRTGVRVVLSNSGGEISGRALDGRKEPAATYVAIAFPVDSSRWYPGSPHLGVARPDGEMQFRLRALPPGDYWVAAVETFDDRSMLDPDVLRRLTAIARRVTLSSGQSLAADIPIGRIGR